MMFLRLLVVSKLGDNLRQTHLRAALLDCQNEPDSSTAGAPAIVPAGPF